MTLPPFNPNATCPKCGGVQPDGEHMALTCTACGYAWPEAPMDVEPKP